MDVELQCRCGKVHGWLRDASPSTVSHTVCYCDDCQAFLHHLGRADLLDPHGGSDVVQAAPDAVTYDRGTENIACVRLGPKGLHRWYATCCKTPLGNTLEPSVPFVGMVHEVLGDVDRVAAFGPPVRILGKFAVGEPPPGSTELHVRALARLALRLLGWKLRGRTWPHPFFDRETKKPRYPISVLTRDEREKLRPLCGPRP